MSKIMTLKPRLSEKAYGLSQIRNNYVFIVPSDANKLSVAESVSQQFGVTVLDVNMTNIKGKPKRTVRKGGRPTTGSRSNMKKAYVTLKAGDSIPIFAAEEKAEAEAAKEAQKASKKEKK